MKDYQSSLDALLREKRLLSEDGLQRPSVSQALDETYTVISQMLDDNGPMFITDIADVIHECFVQAPNWQRDFEQANKYAVAAALSGTTYYAYSEIWYLEHHHTINSASLQDAIKSVYGNYDKLKVGTHGRPTTSIILYKTEQSLTDFIKKHTKKRTVVVIDWNK